MSTLKTILKSDGFRRVVCWIGAQYIRLVRYSGRWRVVRGEIPRAYWDEGKPFILAFWHGRLLMMPYCWDLKKTIHMLISQHRDGQLIARTVGHFGIQTAAGSSTRGGTGALRTMLKALKAGEYVGITPDGPKGPRMRASDGVVQIARMSGVPVIPATYAVRRRKVLGSWDRFVVAWPFSRGVIVWGDPVEVPRDADTDAIEAARCAVEDGLNAITEEADRLMGCTVIEPAPPAETAQEAAP